MNRYFDAKLGMLKTTTAFLHENVSITGTISQIAAIVIELNTCIVSIKLTSQEAELNIAGITENKTLLKKKVCKFAKNISGNIYVYADNNNLSALQGQTKVTLSDLIIKKDDELPQILQDIYNTAAAIVNVTPPATNPLIPYGVDSARLTSFQTLIDSYEASTFTVRGAIVSRKVANMELELLFKDSTTILRKLDRLIDNLEDEYPQFHREYSNNRDIVGPMRKPTRIAGTITDPGGNPVARVTVTAISAIPPFITYETTSNSEGNYSINIPKFRLPYILKCNRYSYNDVQEADITLKVGKTTHKNITMVPM
jgi:hypothetical protein